MVVAAESTIARGVPKLIRIKRERKTGRNILRSFFFKKVFHVGKRK